MKASWTYEVPPAGADAAGLEDYLVETSDGVGAGKVVTMLERERERYLVVDGGTPPFDRDRRAIRWEDVESVDHQRLTVRLRLRGDELEDALELDPGRGVEEGDAEASRVTELPSSLEPSFSPEAPGPRDRPTYAVAMILFALGLIALLSLALAASGTEFTWEFALFAVPALLLAAAAVTAYRTYREPYER